MATWMDKLLFLLIIILTITSFFLVKRLLEPGNLVKIISESKTLYVLSLNEDRVVSAKGPLGDNVVEIRSGRVRMKDAPCPDKLCINQGWIDRGAIICLPNRIVVMVGGAEGNRQYDAISH